MAERALLTLDDHLLRDIGLRRSDVLAAAYSPLRESVQKIPVGNPTATEAASGMKYSARRSKSVVFYECFCFNRNQIPRF
jgi:Domain of unknown function (DUF1127)